MFGIFGPVEPPPGVNRFAGGALTGLPDFLNVILRTLIMGASIYALITIMLAGYAFLSASGDPKKVQEAVAKIWQSVIGLVIVAGAFVIAAILGILLFGDPNAILRLQIYGPN